MNLKKEFTRFESGDPSRKEPGKFLAQYGINPSKIYGLSLPLPIPDVLCFFYKGRYHFYVAYFNVILPNEITPQHVYKPLYQPLTRLNKLKNQNPSYFNTQFECVYDYITTVFLEQFFNLTGWKMFKWTDKEKICIKGNPYKGHSYPYYCYHPVENEFTFFTEQECQDKKPSQLDYTFNRSKIITFKSPEHFPYIPHSNFECGVIPHVSSVMDWAIRNQHYKMVRSLNYNLDL